MRRPRGLRALVAILGIASATLVACEEDTASNAGSATPNDPASDGSSRPADQDGDDGGVLGKDGGSEAATSNPDMPRIWAGQLDACATVDGRLKCWGVATIAGDGATTDGILGLGDKNQRGDDPGEMGAALPYVDLGTGRTVREMALGFHHTCALLDNEKVKCWGQPSFLGIGATSALGDGPGEMGDALPYLDLGSGRTAKAIGAGFFQTCALLDNGKVKCWGYGRFLGIGDVSPYRGDAPGEMGDALPAVELGTGRTAKAIAVGYSHVCALLDNGTLKCWGESVFGELGSGTNVDVIGDAAPEMGDNLAPVNLGTGRTVKALAHASGTNVHMCAILDNDTLKCWGRGYALGLESMADRGKAAADMGDNLPAVDLGTGRTPKAVSVGQDTTCVLLDDSTIKCFGARPSATVGTMGDALAAVSLGTGRHVVSVASGGPATCAVLDTRKIKCWGEGGLLGLGDKTARSAADPGVMGDALPYVDTGF